MFSSLVCASETFHEEGQKTSRIALPWKHDSGKSFAIGYANGLWGKFFAQELNTKIPFWQSEYGSVGARVRGIAIHSGDQRFDLGGRLELYGASPVLLNFVRLYGGGGYQLFYPVGSGAPSDKKIDHGLGGYYGFEFFFRDYVSFDIEIGGQGSSVASGATIMAGVVFYPFTRL